ncbi:hypothetical protein DL93DRAFT_2117414 [Clavulina sp. PMI_390]|nr:hypothetical protein DL93DRAFT_2117414 [Clavulina sp. PMI_390]
MQQNLLSLHPRHHLRLPSRQQHQYDRLPPTLPPILDPRIIVSYQPTPLPQLMLNYVPSFPLTL